MLLTREQLQERLIALHEASLELTKDVPLEVLLEKIVSIACELSDANYAALGVLDDNGSLKKFITVGMAQDEINKIAHPPVGKGLIGELMNTEAPLRLPILQEHPHSVGFPANHPAMKSFLGVPIRSGSKQWGQIYLTEKIGAPEFTSDDEKIIQMLATYAAAAIQNVELHENSRRLAIFEERNRIGMDLHDGIIQSIYGVGLTLENAQLSLGEDINESKERITQSIAGLNQVIRDIRSYILDLKPRQMGNEGLIQGLSRLISEYRSNTFADAQLSGSETDLRELPDAHAMALFHICQEALANTAKHAKAKKVQITVWTTADRMLIEIHDNGKGFNTEQMQANIGHGLANIHARARSVGGDVDITSILDEGTTILVWVPRKLSDADKKNFE